MNHQTLGISPTSNALVVSPWRATRIERLHRKYQKQWAVYFKAWNDWQEDRCTFEAKEQAVKTAGATRWQLMDAIYGAAGRPEIGPGHWGAPSKPLVAVAVGRKVYIVTCFQDPDFYLDEPPGPRADGVVVIDLDALDAIGGGR